MNWSNVGDGDFLGFV